MEGVALLLGLYAWLYAFLLNFSLLCLRLSFRFSALCFYYIKSKQTQSETKQDGTRTKNDSNDNDLLNFGSVSPADPT